MWYYGLYMIWLIALAYVDYYTGYVYCRMCTLGIIPAVICIVNFFTNNDGSFSPVLECIVIMIIFVRILGLTGCIGGGDADVFVITTTVNTVFFAENGIKNVFVLLFYNYNLLFLAMLLFILRYIRRIDWKHLKMDKSYPLLPSVYMSTVITGMVILLLYN